MVPVDDLGRPAVPLGSMSRCVPPPTSRPSRPSRGARSPEPRRTRRVGRRRPSARPFDARFSCAAIPTSSSSRPWRQRARRTGQRCWPRAPAPSSRAGAPRGRWACDGRSGPGDRPACGSRLMRIHGWTASSSFAGRCRRTTFFAVRRRRRTGHGRWSTACGSRRASIASRCSTPRCSDSGSPCRTWQLRCARSPARAVRRRCATCSMASPKGRARVPSGSLSTYSGARDCRGGGGTTPCRCSTAAQRSWTPPCPHQDRNRDRRTGVPRRRAGVPARPHPSERSGCRWLDRPALHVVGRHASSRLRGGRRHAGGRVARRVSAGLRAGSAHFGSPQPADRDHGTATAARGTATRPRARAADDGAAAARALRRCAGRRRRVRRTARPARRS